MLTVVIPTKNRPAELARTLDSLAIQTTTPDELIVVDQSTTAFKFPDLPFAIRYIHDPAITGGAPARNVALDMVRNTFVLFLDDDVILQPEFIAELLAVYEQHPEADGVSGVITNYTAPPMWRRLFNRIFYLGHFFDERQPLYWNHGKFSQPIRVRKLGAGLMSFRTASIGSVRFDTRLSGVSLGEDVDFCYALRRPTLFVAPKAKLVHLKTNTAREQFHWIEREARSAYYFFGRHCLSNPLRWLQFAWLNIGLVSLATMSALKRRSYVPFTEFGAGGKAGFVLATGFWLINQ